MSEEPCQKEKEERDKAAKEWNSAVEELKPYISTEPIDPYEDIQPLSQEEEQLYFQASDRVNLASEKYREAWLSYSECRKKYSKHS